MAAATGTAEELRVSKTCQTSSTFLRRSALPRTVSAPAGAKKSVILRELVVLPEGIELLDLSLTKGVLGGDFAPFFKDFQLAACGLA